MPPKGEASEKNIDRQTTENTLPQSEARLRALLAALPDMIMELSVDGRIINMAPPKNKDDAMPSAEFVGKHIQEVFSEKTAAQTSFALGRAIESNQINAFEFETRMGGTPRVMEARIVASSSTTALMVIRDITQRKWIESERENMINELELKNRESETLHESLASIVGTFEFTEIVQRILEQIRRVIPYDTASVWRVEGKYQYIITGVDLPSEIEIPGTVLIVNEENSAYPLLTGQLPYILNNNVQVELSDFHEPPHNYIHSWLAIPMRTRGKIIGLIALDGKQKDQFNEHHAGLAVTFANQLAIALENASLFSDLQAELEIRKQLISELEGKNAELESFTYTVSHDLKSPLFTIQGFLGYLEQDALSDDRDRLKSDVQRITDATDKMQRLLNELLELSRVGRITNESVSVPLDELINEVVELVQGRLTERGVEIIVGENLPTVFGDKARLLEVLQNLIDNAAKFMGDQKEPRIEIGCEGEEDHKPILYVRDNGMGIAPEHYERIFGLFNKLDPKTEGTGIGLALVKRIVEVHGGRIWVQSEAGRAPRSFSRYPIPDAAVT